MKYDRLYQNCHKYLVASQDEDDDDEDFQYMQPSMKELILKMREQRVAREELAKQETPIRAPLRSGGWVLVHKSTKKPGFWQATYFNEEDEPWGDSESPNFAKLLEHASGNGVDWLAAQRVGNRREALTAAE